MVHEQLIVYTEYKQFLVFTKRNQYLILQQDTKTRVIIIINYDQAQFYFNFVPEQLLHLIKFLLHRQRTHSIINGSSVFSTHIYVERMRQSANSFQRRVSISERTCSHGFSQERGIDNTIDCILLRAKEEKGKSQNTKSYVLRYAVSKHAARRAFEEAFLLSNQMYLWVTLKDTFGKHEAHLGLFSHGIFLHDSALHSF